MMNRSKLLDNVIQPAEDLLHRFHNLLLTPDDIVYFRIVDVPLFVHSPRNLIDVAGKTAHQPRGFPKLREIELQKIPFQNHGPEERRSVSDARCRHLLFNYGGFFRRYTKAVEDCLFFDSLSCCPSFLNRLDVLISLLAIAALCFAAASLLTSAGNLTWSFACFCELLSGRQVRGGYIGYGNDW